MLSRPRACWSAGVAGAPVQPALAARAVAWTVQVPGRRLTIGDRLAVLRHKLAGGEGRASRVGEDGESHPWRILWLGEDRASKLARSRSYRVHVVDGEGHAPARWAALARQDRRHDVLETLGRAHL